MHKALLSAILLSVLPGPMPWNLTNNLTDISDTCGFLCWQTQLTIWGILDHLKIPSSPEEIKSLGFGEALKHDSSKYQEVTAFNTFNVRRWLHASELQSGSNSYPIQCSQSHPWGCRESWQHWNRSLFALVVWVGLLWFHSFATVLLYTIVCMRQRESSREKYQDFCWAGDASCSSSPVGGMQHIINGSRFIRSRQMSFPS